MFAICLAKLLVRPKNNRRSVRLLGMGKFDIAAVMME